MAYFYGNALGRERIFWQGGGAPSLHGQNDSRGEIKMGRAAALPCQNCGRAALPRRPNFPRRLADDPG